MTKSTRSQLGLFVFGAVSLLVGWRPLVETFSLAVHSDAYTHILLILPVSVFLIYLERRLLTEQALPSVSVGSIFLSVSVLITLCTLFSSNSVDAGTELSITMTGLVLWWIGAFVLWFGLRAAQAAAFPLLFLFGLIPLPPAVLDRIVVFLQVGSAWSAHALFWVCGIPVNQTGIFLTIPGLTIQVAQECSSIRSSSMLVVTTLVVAQMLLRSPWRKMLLIAAAIPLSIAKNGLRIWVIAMLGTHVDPGYLTGRLHHEGGPLFLAVALICVAALLWLLRRGEAIPA
ncbi:MAG TPA: exosortase/archaeosortase family protein [Chroococcales cyanobacterium]